MADERIDIEIGDKVSPNVRKKILEIAEAARLADSAVLKLKTQLASVNDTALNKLAASSAKVTNALARETNAQARLTSANARMTDATNRAALSQQKLATESAKTAAAQSKAEIAATRNAVAQQKVAIETNKALVQELKAEEALNKAAIAEINAASAKQRLNSETTKSAIAQERLSGELKQTELRQQRLATETQRTSAAQSNAAASASRAELATLRLKTAQDKLNASTTRSNQSLGNFIRTAAAFAGVGFSGVAIVQAADAYTVLENKLRNVIDSEQQLVTVGERVFDVANRTRAPVQDTAQAFQRFDLALQQLGASQEESLRLTETVNKALVVSGSTTSEQASALLQLSQAFNKGKLDGDEFRSVMELMPSAADAIAKQLGVTRGELLKLAPQGKITAEVMRQAFATAADKIDEKFAQTVPTLGQSLVVLRNSATQFFGEINKRLGVTEAMARAILWLADNMKLVAIAGAALGGALLVAFGPAILGAIVAATKAVVAFTVALATNPIGLLIVGITTAVALFAAFKDEVKLSEDGVVTLGDTARAVFQLIGETVAPVVQFFRDVWNAAFNEVESRSSGFVGILGKALNNVVSIAKTIVNGYIALWVGAYNSIIKGWRLFPGALKDIVVGAFNGIISVVESGINGVLNGLEKLLELANDAAEFLGINPVFNTDFDVDLSRYKGELTGAASELGGIVKKEFADAFNTDFIGQGVDAVAKRAREISQQRIAQEQAAGRVGALRGEGTGLVKSLSSEELEAAEKRADALAKVNRELNSELRLLGLLGPKREIQQQFEQINNELLNKKITLTKEEQRAILGKLQTLQREKGIQQELDSIYDSSIGKFQQIADGLEASNRAYQMGIINAETYANKLVELNAQAANLRLTMGDGTWADVFTSSMARVVETYEGSLPAMADAFGNLFTQLSDGFANSIGRAIVYSENLGESLRNVAQNALAELISAIIKMGIQWLVQSALQKTAATTALAAQTAASVAAAATTAAAWATPAALVSLASFGANSAPAAAGIAATTALAQGLAAVPGFAEGGYTGNVGRKEVAGVVHGNEYVMDAASTERIGVGNLDALRRGAANVQQGTLGTIKGANGAGAAPVNGQGDAASQSGTTVNMKTINLVDSSMLGDYLDSSDSDEVFINKISRNSEQIRRAING